MDAWLKPLLYALSALLLLPFVLTHVLFSSAHYDAEKARIKKALLPALLLNLLFNAAAGYAFSSFLFHNRRPWSPLRRLVLSQNASWPDLLRFALLVALCTAFGLLLGLLLRRLLLRRLRSPVSEARRAVAILLCACAAAVSFFVCCWSVDQNNRITIAEVCRKTSVFFVDPDQTESLGESNREISFVLLSNPGPLDCVFDTLYLSESDRDLTALPFRRVTVPACGTRRLTMDYVHGLDLSKKDATPVYLSLRPDTVLDEVLVPALREHESFRLSASGQGTVHAYLPSVSRTLEPPTFSRLSGFYPEGFDLTLSAPAGLEIRYTLDGSDPSVDGLPYSGPIRVEDPTPSPNVWSVRTDVSAGFLQDPPHYTVPDQPVDKCAVVRAVCVDASGNFSPVSSASYFIGFDGREGYDGLGFVSLVTDPANLFDKETGIYVLGKTYEEKHPAQRKDMNWWWWSANYHERGRSWEREASVQFFDARRSLQLSSPLGIRVKGGASAAMLPRGLNLYARADYGGSSRFDAGFFGDGYFAKHLSLSAGGNDTDLKVRDWLTSRLLQDQELPFCLNRFLPYCLFLNGEYWGNYWLIEQYDAPYFAYYYGLSEENVVVIKNGSVKAGTAEDKNLFRALLHFTDDRDLSVPEDYAAFCALMDPESCAAYYALQVYLGNQDRSLRKNTALWRARSPEDVPAGDTRWRFALFDINHTSCYSDASADSVSWLRGKEDLFNALMNSPDFRSVFYDRLAWLASEVFTPERTEQALAEFTALMEKPLSLEHQRFNRNAADLGDLDRIRAFIRDRQAYILDLCARQPSATPFPTEPDT